MKILHKKTFWIIAVIILIAAAGIYLKASKPQKEELITASVSRGNLKQTVSATGKVESASETNLNFTTQGKLAKLYVKAGEPVKAGQFLAQLELKEPQSQVTAAAARVKEAEADLAKIKAGASTEDVVVSQKSVDSAQATLLAAQNSLTNAQATQEQGMLSLKDELLDDVGDAIFNSKEALDAVDDILTSSYERFLGNVNQSTYYQSKSQYPLTLSQVNALEEANQGYTIEMEMTVLANQTSITLTSVDGLLTDVYNMLLNSQALGDLTQEIIDTDKTAIETEQASIATKITTIQSDISDLNTQSVSYQTDVDEAQAKVDKAEKDLALAQAQLNLKKAGPRDFEVNLYEAKLLSAQASLQSAQATLANYNLVAPLAGLVTKTNYKVGEYVSSAKPLVVMIGESNLEIKVDVPESDITKIKVGSVAAITLDAFSDEQIFPGHITFIDPTETIINDVVYYQVKITFDQEEEEEVKSGMTANVTIATASKENVLYLPARAVIEKDGRKIVRVLVFGQKQEKEVTTGLRADDGLIEIISGLNEGETVITYIKNGK